ncbi:DUF4340 domain-containing protein [Candidatus Poribacteria bacterium]|nr:DUF4340 domain-containing protein [Candidatus Poribacteria bacterium]
MSFRSTLIIIVILVALGITYFLFLHNSEENNTQITKPRISDVYNLRENEIQRIEINYDKNVLQDLDIIKDAYSNWKIKSPFITNADNNKINELITDFVNKQIKEKLDINDYEKFGLEKPTIKVKFWTNHGSNPRIFLIGKKAINFSVYTKETTEDHIFLIESSAIQDLSKSPNDIREKSVLSFNPSTITQIQFGKPEKFTCQKLDDLWKIIYPKNINADSDQIESILSELKNLKVATFEVDGDEATSSLEKYGLLRPRVKLKISRENESIDLDIGSDVITTDTETDTEIRTVYAKSSDIGGIFTISDKILKLLDKKFFDLRDKLVIDFQREDTIKFEIDQRKQKTVGIKLKNIWELQGTQKVPADQQAVSDLLFETDSLKAITFVNKQENQLSKYGLDPPKMKLIFTIKGEDDPTVLKFGNNATEDSVYVMTDKSIEIATVKRGYVDKLYQSDIWLRNKNIFNFKVHEPTRISVKYSDDPSGSFTCQKLDRNWRLTSPVKEDANNAEIDTFLYGLIDLRIDEYLNTNDKQDSFTESNTGLKSPYLQITVELNNKIYTLQVGNKKSGDRYYCRLISESNHIFLIKTETLTNLMTKLKWVRTTQESSLN